MQQKWKASEALAGATEANRKICEDLPIYTTPAAATATPFTPIGTAALRVAHLVARLNVDPGRAALLAGLAFGEARA